MNSHPYDSLQLSNGSTLVMTPCPGTKETTISEALTTLQQAGVTTVVTMNADSELSSLGVASLGDEIADKGMRWFQFPVADDEEPEQEVEAAWAENKEALLKLFNSGSVFAVHCRGGTGRTGLMSAIMMLESGYEWAEAKQLIQSIRPRALTLAPHLNYLRKHYSITE
jgi:protein-tyrosine phosphatase